MVLRHRRGASHVASGSETNVEEELADTERDLQTAETSGGVG